MLLAAIAIREGHEATGDLGAVLAKGALAHVKRSPGELSRRGFIAHRSSRPSNPNKEATQFRVVWSDGFQNIDGTLVAGARLRVLIQAHSGVTEAAQGERQVGMLGAERRPLSFPVSDRAEAVHRARGVGRVRRQHLLADFKSAQNKALRLFIVPHAELKVPQIVQAGGQRRIIGAEDFLVHTDRPLQQGLCLRELAFVEPEAAVGDKARTDVDVILAQQLPPRGQCRLEQRLGLIE